jgi:vacuolar-type H+-ATPase subunit H
MSSQGDPGSRSAVTASIERVLRAERATEEAVEGCRQEAERLRQAARDQARRIGHRTDRRISALHARCTRRIEAEIEAMRRAAAAEERRGALHDRGRARLDLAAARRAAWLAGGEHDRPG